jgi:Metallo-beta-lactamase superfamily
MTLVESATGVIVIDPLISQECAAAALALYRAHRGDKPVTGVIYTHSHLDHFGGVLGVVDADTTVPIIAPEHFMEHAVSENVYAGTAMLRRGMYYGGWALPYGADGTIGMGLGPMGSSGTVGLIAPTVDITATGQEETVDGVRMIFQLTPHTEAPAEMNFHFPPSAPCACPRTPPTTCTTCSPCAAPRSATRASGRVTLPRPSNCSARTPTSRSPPTIGLPGAATTSPGFSPNSATYMPTCMIRPCACSTRATRELRSPKSLTSRRRSMPPGTRTATTARSATT